MENIDLIRKIAWVYHNRTRIDFEDLFQEAYLAHRKALTSYVPENGALTTHVWNCMEKHLINLHWHERKQVTSRSIDVDEFMYPHNNPNPFWLALTPDAQSIAEAVLIAPTAFIWRNPTEVKQRITKVFRRKGWSDTRINNGLACLIKAYSSSNEQLKLFFE